MSRRNDRGGRVFVFATASLLDAVRGLTTDTNDRHDNRATRQHGMSNTSLFGRRLALLLAGTGLGLGVLLPCRQLIRRTSDCRIPLKRGA